jgi:capsular polysaccharide biosynthesis protein
LLVGPTLSSGEHNAIDAWLPRTSKNSTSTHSVNKGKKKGKRRQDRDCCAPVRRGCPRRGHNTSSRCYRFLMYIGLRTSDTLHKKPCRIGPEIPESIDFAPTTDLRYDRGVMAEGNTGSVLGVDAGMAARALGGALLIAIIAAIIVTLVSLAMFLRAPIYEPTARVWVQRELRIGPPSPGPDKRLTETTAAMVRLAASDSVAKEARRSLGLQAGSAELLENLEIDRVQGTTFIDLTYRGTDRKKATQTVNALARVASERLSEAPGKNLAAIVWEEAQVPPAVPEPKPLRNGLLTLVVVWALYAGLTLAMLAVLRR